MAETIASVTPPAVMLVQCEKPPLSCPADRAILTSPAHEPSAVSSRELCKGHHNCAHEGKGGPVG